MVTPTGRLSVAGQGPDGCRRLVIDKKPISLVYARAMAVHYYFHYKLCAFYRAGVRVASSSSRNRFVAFVRAEDQWARRRRRRAEPSRAREQAGRSLLKSTEMGRTYER